MKKKKKKKKEEGRDVLRKRGWCRMRRNSRKANGKKITRMRVRKED
jgi:hypothetical protein